MGGSMSNIILTGDTSGTLNLAAPLIAGSNTQTLVAATGTLAPLIRGTAVSASSTSVNFTDIPSWVKRITVMFSGVSTNGTSVISIQIGSGTIANTGYISTGISTSTGGSVATSSTAMFITSGNNSAAFSVTGIFTICNISGNAWIFNGGVVQSTTQNATGYGGVTLGGVLDRVRITTVNGTDTFDAGTINILYE
jgi:hypothetical protein